MRSSLNRCRCRKEPVQWPANNITFYKKRIRKTIIGTEYATFKRFVDYSTAGRTLIDTERFFN